MDELWIAANPDPESRLPYLLRLPLAGGMVFRTSGTWPRAKALYCYPVNVDEWPEDPEIRRTGRDAFLRTPWRGDRPGPRPGPGEPLPTSVHHRPRPGGSVLAVGTHPQAGPPQRDHSGPRGPAGSPSWEILVDTRERYAYRFTGQQVRTVKRALPCGDYAVTVDEAVITAVERKSLPDLVSSLINGTLRYALGELSALPRAAVVVEDRYSQIFKLGRIRPAVVADGLAELQVRWPGVPIVFCETRQLAQEWTYRYLAAARTWADNEIAAITRISPTRHHRRSGRVGTAGPARPRTAHLGPAPTASPSPTAGDYDPRSSPPGARRTPDHRPQRTALGGLWQRLASCDDVVGQDRYTHFRSWDQNIFTEWHSRYGGRGILIYWHVERGSMVVHSQRLRAFAAEVHARVEGLVRPQPGGRAPPRSTTILGATLHVAVRERMLPWLNVEDRADP